jgi:eukaryotic-like serine/threonine-protein kinase
VERAETIVAGRYRLHEQLGRGGMGVVWRAHDERLDRDVALKVLHPWVADDPELRERFEREAAALARLEHPNLVRLYDVLESEGQTVLVLELVDGVALDTLIAGRSLAWDEARRFCAPVAAALAHAHARGVVHRDLTPANLLVERGAGRVVVTDFGLARLARSTRSAPISGVLAGTPEYWAPEQAAGHETGPATDLYALGCILFRMLAGRMPFEGEDRLATGLRRAHEQAPSLAGPVPAAPLEAVRLVDRLLARDPARRGDAVGVARALGADLSSLPGADGTDGPARLDAPRALPAPTLVTRILREPATIVRELHREIHSRPPVGRRRVVAALAGVLVALGVAGGGVYAVAGSDPPGVDAPDVVGRRVAWARAEVTKDARDHALPVPKVKIVDRSYSESAPAGAIVAQDPPEGKRIQENGALLVSVSKGSAYAPVPSVAGLEGAAAADLLERNGFTPTRRYAPSATVEAWHAVDTDPAAGTKLGRPVRVALVVSTGPPKRPIPSVKGLDAEAATGALRDLGFVPVIDERPETSVEPGTILGLTPSPGTRTPVGSTVTIAVAREPRWEAVTRLEGTEDASPRAVDVPAGARLVLATTDTSPLGLWGGKVAVSLTGDVNGSTEIDAGQSIVLADPSDGDRTITVAIDVHGSAHWTVAVEAPR